MRNPCEWLPRRKCWLCREEVTLEYKALHDHLYRKHPGTSVGDYLSKRGAKTKKKQEKSAKSGKVCEASTSVAAAAASKSSPVTVRKTNGHQKKNSTPAP